ncbi:MULTISPECIES: hypothetical protein [Streptomyces]|nr:MULTISPECIES: hypothetical protein [unclassified Streptomyces]
MPFHLLDLPNHMERAPVGVDDVLRQSNNEQTQTAAPIARS